ncbi:MAG: condensation domain-containing protein [Acidimicrobiales bacterium]
MSRFAGAAVAGAEHAADRVVLSTDGGADLTFGAWEARSNAVARGLEGRGSRVALLFDAPRWTDFAVAWLGLRKAGAVAVLLSPGADPADLSRALSHSGATGIVCPPGRLARPAGDAWLSVLAEIERGRSSDPVGRSVDPDQLAEVIYPPAPLAPPAPVARSHRDLAELPAPPVEGWLVHAWAPGSVGGQYAMSVLSAGGAVATLGVFDAARLCALVEQRRAATCGLTPALAAAVLASGAARDHDLSSVTRVVLSGPPSAEVRAGLRAGFPASGITVVDGGPRRAPVRVPAAQGPVAVSQEGMLWHEQFTPGSFNLPCLVRRYRGPLDLAALEWALAALVRRHQPLRSTFTVVDGRPEQTVGGRRPVPLAFEDLGPLAPEDRDTRAAGLLADATTRPFDLAAGPLFEPRVVRLGPDDHLLVVRLHHTVFDDWSVDLFRRELSALYTARLAGAPSPLVEPPTAFLDVCRRRRAALEADRGVAQRTWWRQELAGAPLAVQLPIGGDDDDRQPGEPLRVDLPPALVADLRALAPRLRATPFMTVLAAFSMLLSRVTGQDDLVIATVLAHRDASDVEPLIGCFTKKVPLRLRLDGDPTFAELLARTRGSLLGSLSHQDLGFDTALAEALGGPAADHGVVPQVAVVFQGEAPQRVKLAMPRLTVGPYEVRGEARGERHFSSGPRTPWGDGIYLRSFLILSLLETAEGLALVARGVFSRPKARRLLEEFEALLAEVVADPTRPVSPPTPVPDPDVVDLRGFRASRRRLEAALAGCPGVADVAVAVRHDLGVEPRLVAYVVADPNGPPPTLAVLRAALWADLPGALWPADAVLVDVLARRPDGVVDIAALPPPDPPGPPATVDPLTAMWGEISGATVDSRRSYWQDFTFFQVLAEAREAGLAVGDEHVARCRTPEMLAVARAAALGPARR